MVEGAGAEVAAQPFGNTWPERGGIAAHRSLSRILPIAMSALPHLVCPLDPPPFDPSNASPSGRCRTRAAAPPATGTGKASRRTARKSANHVDVAVPDEGRRPPLLGRRKRVDQGQAV